MGIRVAARVTVPLDEIEIRAMRSQGPGGQSVNTTDSKVELRWDIGSSPTLSAVQRDRLLERLSSRLTADGVLILRSQEHRSQHRNRDAVIQRFKAIVGEALQPPRVRVATRPTRASRRRRLDAKRRRSETKRLRRPPSDS